MTAIITEISGRREKLTKIEEWYAYIIQAYACSYVFVIYVVYSQITVYAYGNNV